ncbi:MAG: FtsW/RodA/SpoVE family cell cycle protein, partial [Lachnospiraceae bacterium]
MSKEQNKDQRKKNSRYFDYSLLFIVLFLIGFGLVMLYSTSAYNGQEKFQDAGYYVKKQLVATTIGIVGMVIMSQIDYRIWKKLWLLAYVGAFGMCTLVLFIGEDIKGAKRWLSIGPLSIQPSEVAKIAIIVFLASIISQMPKRMGKFTSLIKIMLLVSPMVVVVATENLSTAIIILGI